MWQRTGPSLDHRNLQKIFFFLTGGYRYKFMVKYRFSLLSSMHTPGWASGTGCSLCVCTQYAAAECLQYERGLVGSAGVRPMRRSCGESKCLSVIVAPVGVTSRQLILGVPLHTIYGEKLEIMASVYQFALYSIIIKLFAHQLIGHKGYRTISIMLPEVHNWRARSMNDWRNGMPISRK